MRTKGLAKGATILSTIALAAATLTSPVNTAKTPTALLRQDVPSISAPYLSSESAAEPSHLATYCGINRPLLREYHPDEYAALLAQDSDGVLPYCVKGSAPPGAVINEAPYYNQCTLGSEKLCHSGCAPVSLKMALEYAGLGEQDVGSLWDDLNTREWYGAIPEAVESALRAQDPVLLEGVYGDRPWEKLREDIEAGRVILIRTEARTYDGQCRAGECPPIPHYLLIVGITDNELIVDDPYTGVREDAEAGHDLVITRRALERGIYGKDNTEFVIMTKAQAQAEAEKRAGQAEGDAAEKPLYHRQRPHAR